MAGPECPELASRCPEPLRPHAFIPDQHCMWPDQSVPSQPPGVPDQPLRPHVFGPLDPRKRVRLFQYNAPRFTSLAGWGWIGCQIPWSLHSRLADASLASLRLLHSYHTTAPQTFRKRKKKLCTLLDLCVSSLRRGHANLLCIVPILTDDPRRESENTEHTFRWTTGTQLRKTPSPPKLRRFPSCAWGARSGQWSGQ